MRGVGGEISIKLTKIQSIHFRRFCMDYILSIDFFFHPKQKLYLNKISKLLGID